MTDIPDNVDLNWIARTLVALRADLVSLHEDIRTLREDVDVSAVILRRVDRNQTSFREEVRALRARIEILEGKQ